MSEHPYSFLNRRLFIQYLAMIGIGGRTLLQVARRRGRR
jgi:hypothetical protein